MAAVCPSYDDRLTEVTQSCPAFLAAAGSLITWVGSATASVGGGCPGADIAAER